MPGFSGSGLGFLAQPNGPLPLPLPPLPRLGRCRAPGWGRGGSGIPPNRLLTDAYRYDQVRDFEGVMPSECLPVLPLMLAGTVGASLALHTDGERAATLLVASYVFQGCGFLIATMKLSTWMSRNVLFRHPHNTRIVPIFFMAVGPPGFTASAFVSLGQRAAQLFADNTPVPGDALFAASFLVALMLFGQCLWFLLATSVIWLKSATRPGRPVGWSLAWFATTFPLNVERQAGQHIDESAQHELLHCFNS
ncbi:hypothetical protein AURDEDRAFT_170118 [Auricularia subglabra TFB-10046 SS5]|nr:hypothetical protein AURDEDRAFT_170118 [Auricularia subglabra TFB-10046 SS5]